MSSATAVLLACSVYDYRFLSYIGMYRSLMAWQLTICSIHVAPIIALRLLSQETLGAAVSVAWMLVALWCRRPHRTIFSAAVLALELAAATAELSPQLLDTLFALQVLIVGGFWLAVRAPERRPCPRRPCRPRPRPHPDALARRWSPRASARTSRSSRWTATSTRGPRTCSRPPRRAARSRTS